MSTILVLNTNILCVDPQDTGDQWETPDQIIPKHVAEGATLETVTLPEDYAPGKYTYAAGTFTLSPVVPVPPTQDQIKAELAALDLKRIRPTAEGDAAYLATLNAQAVALRGQFK